MTSTRTGWLATLGSALVLLVSSIASAQPTRIYFSNVGAETLSRASPDGSGIGVVRSTTFVHGVAINPLAGRMYLSDAGAGAIVNCALDGTACSTVVASAGFPGDLDVDLVNGHIYWARFDDHSIRRTNLDGSAPMTIVSGAALSNFAIALDVPGGKIYWGAFGASGQVGRANLDGSMIENLTIGLSGSMRGVAVNPAAGHLYWSDENSEEIWRANLDGSSRAAIVSGVSGMVDPWGLELDIPRGHLYWVADGGVWRSGLDGSSPVQLVTATGQHSAFALEIPIVADGGACATSGECLGGNCVDGFCCESACTGFCMSCAGAETGMANGECHPGLPGVAGDPTCVDGEPCTDDFCGTGTSCMFVNNTASCEDGDFCTGPDTCAAGACVGGPMICDAGPPERDGGRRDGSVPGTDASTGMDAAAGTDSGPGTTDGSVAMDGGITPDGGGCSCRAVASGSGAPPWILLGLVAFVLRRRR